ncbi:MAG: hypothetical protein A3J09_01530 [Candidatus Zambryskibacteria bacterium RIFCSPLOWO2_02_FULL_51_21]|uniref:Formyl transferase N-terminal domain-containing protein n=1 Tax=Candidatus Zambryskibacteria bacterium RIFCSPHIGHO2_02_FULL_43_37 TaxID=1802749 RepID=A0A1G2TIK7_9BACT|nr:MAG: hypothetical protein A2723_01530 [Candidatus Zambryskibacteria bacterium RIFCSPHIGHO2_01_FULL_52_18]OHA96509.1 MAG: hypothetical protein A3D49_01370 [Candidatus Zambryskibacteria bacterium RIFCSPHIGHO2_02_FULL_43_37]OHB07179.1 MAG: hypothetical protein A2944_01135 [Candidatus Zambryskibacteria bacterium RIFCSPLOWO2_01_FULL_52_12]OHB11227.1 MAG: hypothetical protein A3J09_01530 [Candidatus Zambryskibacteria bacterium RIFCSPLOWO2_02_FULL_51_21]
MQKIKFAFFGSSKFSEYVLDELEKAGYSPILKVTDAKEALPELPAEIDLCVVASFGRILPKEYLEIPKEGFINVHPSLLPDLRGPSPIQNLILQNKEPGITVIKMDEKMDHGPILAQEKVGIEPWPDHYAIAEEKLGRAGGKLLLRIFEGEALEREQDHDDATYVKMVKKEDGLLDLKDNPETNLRKVLAYSTWPGAHIFFKRKTGEEIRVVVRNAKIIDNQFIPTRVIPAGKKEMDWQDFLRGNV